MTVLEAIQRSADFLARKGVDSPRLQAELLLAHVLQVPRMRLYLDFERALTAGQADALRALVVRRGQREPLQHLVGTVCFCGLELTVNRHVLIPRPETELLAEAAWQWLGNRGAGAAALDFGTGSGCLALALARHCPEATVVAVDVSPDALAAAQENARQLGLAARVAFRTSDGFSGLEPGLQFDLVVSNPPYIPSAEIASLQPEVRDHDPILALDGGRDGLDFYRRLARETQSWLKPGGRLMLEFGDGQSEAVAALLEAQDWLVEAPQEDYQGRKRWLAASRRGG